MAQPEVPELQLDEDMNDSLIAEESQRTNAESASSSASKDSRKLTKNDVGEIGYWNKNGVFQSMTNFSVECVEYVVDNIGSTSANGFLFRVIPKGCVLTSGDQNNDARYVFIDIYLVACNVNMLGIHF